MFLKLFDEVQPVAQYGAELWGLDKAAIHIQKVQKERAEKDFWG